MRARRCPTRPEIRKGAPQARHRVNGDIRISMVRVIDADGEQLGIMSPEEGRRIAGEQGLDLVEVAPDARPPVCKILDYGKYKYEVSKRAKPQKAAKTKTIKLRPKTGDHDLETKFSQARKFLADGDRVKFVMRLRGRENAYIDRWCKILATELATLEDAGQVSIRPRQEGRAVIAQVDPVSKQ